MSEDVTSAIPAGNLMEGKRGLIMGVANDHSLAWGIAHAVGAQGAELAFTYQGDSYGRRVEPLAASVNSDIVMPCDVSDPASLDRVFERLQSEWGSLDFVVHSIAFAGKEELRGRYVDTSREGFLRALEISCYSFTEVARRASEMMGGREGEDGKDAGGSLITLSYLGASRVMPNYNVMGVAKAALEASVRYMAVDLGRDNIRVNALSAGTMRTLSGAGIGDARYVYRYNHDNAPLQRNVELSEVGNAGLYLLSDLSSGVSGEVMHVDAGFHVVGIPKPASGN